MAFRVRPIPYFVGLGAGLIALSCLGAGIAPPDLVRNFSRFHQHITPEFNYFPTARQVIAIVNAPVQPAPKVYVIVGGSSVFNGVGQEASQVWTRDLQDRLGPEYRVINLAQRAGTPGDFGNIAAEWLVLHSQPVIYLADGTLGDYAHPLSSSFFRHIIFDAWHRGYLLPWPRRDDLLSRAPWGGPAELRGPALGELLDRFLNFNDLWEYVAFEYFGLVWSPLMNDRSFEPRRLLPDPEWPPEKYAERGYPADFAKGMAVIKPRVRPLDSPVWGYLADLNDLMIPPRLRAVTLAVIHIDSPRFWKRLDPPDRDLVVLGLEKMGTMLRSLGFFKTLIVAVNYQEDDYIDWIHFSVSGGKKLAADVAPSVRTMASELGYLK